MSIQQYEDRTSTALATSQDAAVTRLAEWAHSADAAYHVAQRLSDSAFVPQQFRGKPVETTAAILAGLEVGLSPMQAIRSFDIIGGTAAPRAITLRALVQSHGHEMVLVESTVTRCRMKGRRRDSQEWQTVTWTIERAQSLGLTSKDNWKKQPAAMLMARATSELARLIASDAILGIGYSSEEVADGGTYDQQVTVDVTTPAPTPGTRKMSRRMPDPEPEAEPEPVEAEVVEEPPLAGITEAQVGLLGMLCTKAGLVDRDSALAYVADTIGHEVASRKELTKTEASIVIDALQRDTADQS